MAALVFFLIAIALCNIADAHTPKYYRLYDMSQGLTDATWQDAEDECIKYGSHLASIHSADDQHEAAEECGSMHCWIGLNDINNDGNWVFSDGTSIDYTNWNDDEYGRGRLDDKCVLMLFTSNYKWYQYDCNKKKGILCNYTPYICTANNPFNPTASSFCAKVENEKRCSADNGDKCKWIKSEDEGYCDVLSGITKRSKKDNCREQTERADCESLSFCGWSDGIPSMTDDINYDIKDEVIFSIDIFPSNGNNGYGKVQIFGLLVFSLFGIIFICYHIYQCYANKEEANIPLLDKYSSV